MSHSFKCPANHCALLYGLWKGDRTQDQSFLFFTPLDDFRQSLPLPNLSVDDSGENALSGCCKKRCSWEEKILTGIPLNLCLHGPFGFGSASSYG
jgi:hypothetical protein